MFTSQSVINLLKIRLKSAVNTVELSNTVVVSRTREILADTVQPYRWIDTQINGFISDGLIELAKMRSDIARNGNKPITSDFEAALSYYAASRALALDNDLQNNNGALSDKLFKMFVELTDVAPYFFEDELLNDYISNAVNLLISIRPDLKLGADGKIIDPMISDGKISLPVQFQPAIVEYAAALGFCQSGKHDEYQCAMAKALDLFKSL